MCLAMRVGKPSHSYHPENFYVGARSPAVSTGGVGGGVTVIMGGGRGVTVSMRGGGGGH